GLTRAAETAKFQRNQLRCTRLADVAACDDALKSKPDDQQLIQARQAAVASTPAATPAASSSTSTQLAAAPAQPEISGTAPQEPRRERQSRSRKTMPQRDPSPAEAPTVASLVEPEPLPPRTYTNDAPPGRTN